MESGVPSPDHGDVGQTAQPGSARWRGGALGLAVLLAAGVLTGCGTNLADAATVLTAAQGVLVHQPDGHTVTGRIGMTIRPGDVVRTSAGGFADLTTLGRQVYLASRTALSVRNGGADALWYGSALADGRQGPPLTLTAGGLTVRTGTGSVVRLDHSYAIRVGALVGHVGVATPEGQAINVAPLYQVVATGVAVSMQTPLQLRDDRIELATGLGLVLDDVLLNRVATGLDRVTPRAVVARTAAYVRADPVLPRTAPASDRVLPLAIARAARGGTLAERYARALGLRVAGGSWAVVVSLMRTTAPRTFTALSELEQSGVFGRTTSSVVAALGAVAGVDGSGQLGGGGPAGGGGSTPAPTLTPTPGQSGGSPSPTGRPRHSSSPSPSGGLLSSLSSLLPPSPTGTPIPILRPVG
jgi:hypothetical protein